MSTPENSQQTDADLTPEARQIIGKARRSFGFSIALLLFGLIAVAGAVVYRINRESAAPVAAIADIHLPAGAELISVSPSGGSIYVSYRVGTDQMVRVIDAISGEMTDEIAVVADAE